MEDTFICRIATLDDMERKWEYEIARHADDPGNWIVWKEGAHGYKRVTVGVEPEEVVNKQIYAHYGFTEFVKTDTETYPDGTVINVEYYVKKL